VRHLTFEPEPDWGGPEPVDPDLVAAIARVLDETTPAADLPGLLQALAGGARAAGARRIIFEAEPADEALDRLCRSAGFDLTRTTLQLRCPLPVPAARRGRAPAEATLTFRPFEPGRDEPSWLDVNRRAFAWHPEQGGWTLADLLEREHEPWFRSEGFLVHDSSFGTDQIDGFCWTKIHGAHEPPLGEIYVIAVDPDRHGRGLGRALVLAGLDWLAAVGLQVGMLYVESDNEPARHLYRELGFTEHLAHRWWRRDL